MRTDMLGVGVSFTGTQTGMTEPQKGRVREILAQVQPAYVVHGACIGADDEFDAIAADMGIGRHAFPCTITSKRVPDSVLRARGGSSVVIHPPAPPLARNRTIVDVGNVTIACPKERIEQLRSGTWATVRYARRCGKFRELVLPEAPPAADAVGRPLSDVRTPTREANSPSSEGHD